MLTGEGEVERFVSVAALQLERGDGRVLGQLGDVEGRGVRASCRLPGNKQSAGEVPMDAIHRVLQHSLAPVAHAVEITDSSCESMRMSSAHIHAVRTTYTRIVHQAKLNMPFESLKLDGLQIEFPCTSSSRCGPEFAFVLAKRQEESSSSSSEIP